ncbi:MAG: hypothetical protein AAGF11_34375 [Myxococcota bacterium]
MKRSSFFASVVAWSILGGCSTPLSEIGDADGTNTDPGPGTATGPGTGDGPSGHDSTDGGPLSDGGSTDGGADEPGDGDTDDEPEPEPEQDVIAKSTILFTQVATATPENFAQYEADGIFWGHMPSQAISSDSAMQGWASEVEGFVGDGRSYFGRVEFDWGWRWMIDFMDDPGAYWARNLDDQVIPFHAGSTYGGHTWNWQSHHGPDFTAWLEYQVDRLLFAPVTHIMIDSQTSATRTALWLGGDFSPHSMAGFAEYLAEQYTADELSGLGILDITTFDYRTYLLDQGYDLSSYMSNAYSVPSRTPLYEDFVYYQRQRLNEVMEEVLTAINDKAPGVPVGATTSMMEARGYVDSDRLDYLAGELSHTLGPLSEVPFNPITHYKAAEAVGKTLILFPYPQAWQEIRAASAPRHARTWVAQAYAMGAIFTIPGNIWVGGSETWDPGAENFYDVYQFVRAREGLLDGYRAVSNVGLVYAVLGSLNTGSMNGNNTIQASTRSLISQNFSFDYLVFGDPGNPVVPSMQQLDQYDVLVIDDDYDRLSDAQQQVLDGAAADLVSVSDSAQIGGRLSAKIDVYEAGALGNERISALPRMSAHDDKAPYVVHLVNRQYDPGQDLSVPHDEVTVRVGAEMFPEPVHAAQFHSVGQKSRTLTLETDGEGNVTVDVGHFDRCWGIVELSH